MPNDSGFQAQSKTNRVEATVLRESLKMRFTQAAKSIVPMSFMVFILGVLLWSACPPSRLVAWLFLSYAGTVGTSIYCKHKAGILDTASDKTIAWLSRRFRLDTVYIGLAVGSGVWWVAAVSKYEIQLLVTVILCFHSIASLVNLATDEKNYLAIMLPNLGQLVIFWIIAGGNGIGIALAVISVIYFLFTFARQNSRVFAESIRIR